MTLAGDHAVAAHRQGAVNAAATPPSTRPGRPAPATAPSTSTAVTTESSSGSVGAVERPDVAADPTCHGSPAHPASGAPVRLPRRRRLRGTTGRTGRFPCGAPPACPTDLCARWARVIRSPEARDHELVTRIPIRCPAGFRTCACRSVTPPRPWPIRWRLPGGGQHTQEVLAGRLAGRTADRRTGSARCSVPQPQPQPQPCHLMDRDPVPVS